ncbi:MAG TPA: hypothetical protein VFB22_09250 [Candidatus Baltobacteraceae bacterium]|nr:hypothetical protein [Candidatus Baltobacteraceae bacterium]
MPSLIAACVALGTPALARADTTAAVSQPNDAGKTALVCRAASAGERQNALYGSVPLLCTTAKQSATSDAARAQQYTVQHRDDQSWVYDIFMLDHMNGNGGN